MSSLEPALASRLARLVLNGVYREYPNMPHHLLDRDEDCGKTPRELHPAFYGCFDWHSSVHSHWSLIRLLRVCPDLAEGPEIRDVFERHITAQNMRIEADYFDHPLRRHFERPYGWAWAMRLGAELSRFDDSQVQIWASHFAVLSVKLANLLHHYLEGLTVPNRVGTHGSTAFALTHAHDYAVALGDLRLQGLIEQRCLDFFGTDVDAPTAYEPSGEDFISPALVEADLMRRVLKGPEFLAWLDRFLPAADAPAFRSLAAPTVVSDPKDYRIGHLIGLALQRAAAFEGIGCALPAADARRALYLQIAQRHQTAGLAQMFDSGYGGGHWLASFAVYLLTKSGPYDDAPMPR